MKKFRTQEQWQEIATLALNGNWTQAGKKAAGYGFFACDLIVAFDKNAHGLLGSDLAIISELCTEFRCAKKTSGRKKEIMKNIETFHREHTMADGEVTWLNNSNDPNFANIKFAKQPVEVVATKNNIDEVIAPFVCNYLISYKKYITLSYINKLVLAREIGFLF